jgi:hypothetical protein
MSRKLFVVAAVLTLAVIGGAYAAVENIKVSGDINLEAVGRDLSLGGTVHNQADSESYLLSQVRLRFDANLTENVSGTVRLINERTWGEEDTFGDNSEINLDLAYIEMKEFLYQPLTIIAGRQLLRYGSGLIVGDPDTNMTVATTATNNYRFGDLSLRKSFDAVRAILDFSPFTIDAIYSKVRQPYTAALLTDGTHIKNNVDLWGVNAAYQWGAFEGITEGYYFGAQNNRYSDSYAFVPVQVLENQDITHVVGGRVQFNPLEKLTLGLEGAYQFGDVQLVGAAYAGNPARVLSAYAIEANAEYRFMTKYNPKIDLNYVYLSGNDDIVNDNGNAIKGWDPMFEDQSLGEISNILFPNSNIQGVKVSGSMMPREDITVGVSYTWLKLADNINYAGADTGNYSPPLGWYSANVYDVNLLKTQLGSEIDAYALYDYTEDVQLKLTGAWFIPGDFFQDTNDDVAYSVRGGVNLNF